MRQGAFKKVPRLRWLRGVDWLIPGERGLAPTGSLQGGLQLGVFVAGVLSLDLSDSAFEAEVFRAGIQSVPKGQVEAAKSLGLSWFQQMRFIVAPQAIKVILPALGNQFIYVVKMSSLISVIGLPELTRRANELNVNEYRPLAIYSFLVIEYLVLIVCISWLVRKLEVKLARQG